MKVHVVDYSIKIAHVLTEASVPRVVVVLLRRPHLRVGERRLGGLGGASSNLAGIFRFCSRFAGRMPMGCPSGPRGTSYGFARGVSGRPTSWNTFAAAAPAGDAAAAAAQKEEASS